MRALPDGSVSTRVIQDEGVTPAKLSDLAGLRGEMGLGNTLGVLGIEFGGTGASTAEGAISALGIDQYVESVISISETVLKGSASIAKTTLSAKYSRQFSITTEESSPLLNCPTSGDILFVNPGIYRISGGVYISSSYASGPELYMTNGLLLLDIPALNGTYSFVAEFTVTAPNTTLGLEIRTSGSDSITYGATISELWVSRVS